MLVDLFNSLMMMPFWGYLCILIVTGSVIAAIPHAIFARYRKNLDAHEARAKKLKNKVRYNLSTRDESHYSYGFFGHKEELNEVLSYNGKKEARTFMPILEKVATDYEKFTKKTYTIHNLKVSDVKENLDQSLNSYERNSDFFTLLSGTYRDNIKDFNKVYKLLDVNDLKEAILFVADFTKEKPFDETEMNPVKLFSHEVHFDRSKRVKAIREKFELKKRCAATASHIRKQMQELIELRSNNNDFKSLPLEWQLDMLNESHESIENETEMAEV